MREKNRQEEEAERKLQEGKKIKRKEKIETLKRKMERNKRQE